MIGPSSDRPDRHTILCIGWLLETVSLRIIDHRLHCGHPIQKLTYDAFSSPRFFDRSCCLLSRSRVASLGCAGRGHDARRWCRPVCRFAGHYCCRGKLVLCAGHCPYGRDGAGVIGFSLRRYQVGPGSCRTRLWILILVLYAFRCRCRCWTVVLWGCRARVALFIASGWRGRHRGRRRGGHAADLFALGI